VTNDKEKVCWPMSAGVLAACMCVCVFDGVRAMRFLPRSNCLCILWVFYTTPRWSMDERFVKDNRNGDNGVAAI